MGEVIPLFLFPSQFRRYLTFQFLIIYYGSMKIGKWHPSGYILLGAKGLLPFLLLTLIALYSLTHLKIDFSLISELPENHELQDKINTERQYFQTDGDFILAMSPEISDLSEGSLHNIEQIINEVEQLPSVGFVVSPLNIQDLKDDGYSWTFESIKVEKLQNTMLHTPLFRKLLLGREGQPGFYIFPEKGINMEKFGGSLLEWSSLNNNKVKLTGLPILKYYYKQMVLSVITRLPFYALILMLIIEFVIYRKIKTTFILGLASLIPMIWALSLFPLVGLDITIDNIIAPVLILGLASSYGIHLIRGRFVYRDGSMREVLNHISTKVIIAGLTTMMGFFPLLISSVKTIRQFGGILVLGIVFSLVFALYGLPVILKKTIVSSDYSQNFLDHLPLPTGKRRGFILFLLITALLIGGGHRSYMDSRVISLLPDFHPYHESNSYFNSYFGGVNELEIICNTGQENGIISEEYYHSVKQLLETLENLDSVSAAIGYSDFINWMSSRIDTGQEAPSELFEPDMYFIGESLELLSDNSLPGMHISSLVDPSYQRHRILLRFATEPGLAGWKAYETMMDDLKTTLQQFALGDVTIGGASVQQHHMILSQKRSIVTGLILFFPFIFLIFLLITKSFIWSFCVLSSPLVEALIYFGVMSWSGIPLTIPSLLAITYILGVSVDDNIFYTFSVRSKLQQGKDFKTALRESFHETGSAILDTSVVIIVVMVCLFFSGCKALAQSGYLLMVSQALVTVYTIWLLPLFFPHKAGESGKKGYVEEAKANKLGSLI